MSGTRSIGHCEIIENTAETEGRICKVFVGKKLDAKNDIRMFLDYLVAFSSKVA